MTEHKIMLFGAAGQIGQAFQNLASQGAVRADWKMGYFSRPECDMTNPAALRAAIQGFQPDVIINAAGVANVDEAEKNPDEADAINFHAVAQLAAQASAMDIPVIHLSTDYVFDGRQTTPYLPDDPMNPLSKYGASKMMGEEALRHELPFHVILRISSVFSAFRRNILTTIVRTFDGKNELAVVNDIIAAPTPAIDIVRAIITIGAKILDGKKDGFGTFHFCGQPACSRYDFTQEVLRLYETHTSRHLPKLTKASRADAAQLSIRPAYSVLDCAKIKDVYNIEQPEWHDGLKEAVLTLIKMGHLPR